jgi:hypothetical protein
MIGLASILGPLYLSFSSGLFKNLYIAWRCLFGRKGMRSSYPSKSGKLDELSGQVLRFFEDRGFSVATQKTDSKMIISVKMGDSSSAKIVDVSLEEDPKGSLAVIFEGLEGSSIVRNSALLSLLGGGFLTLKKLQISEIIERMEKEFWEMVDRFLASS